ncbi:unnamed protein product, partial [marine sediment metagenome]
MNTVKINNPDKINKNIIKKIAELISEGKTVILPTSTIYGLSCKYNDRNAIEKMVITRPTWDEYFASITRQVATRSTCLRRKVGAIIVKDKRILTT